MTLPHGPGGLGSTYASTFNLTIAFADPSGADYALHLRDIDAIATQLLHLQAANVPVLWRPHVVLALGDAYGSESCKTLPEVGPSPTQRS